MDNWIYENGVKNSRLNRPFICSSLLPSFPSVFPSSDGLEAAFKSCEKTAIF